MEGTYRACADRVTRGRIGRLGRGCLLVAAALLSASVAVSDSIAVNAPQADSARNNVAARGANVAMREQAVSPHSGSNDPSSGSLLLAARFPSAIEDEPGLGFQSIIDQSPGDYEIESHIRTIDQNWTIIDDVDVYADSRHVDLPPNDFADTGPGTVKPGFAGLDIDTDRSVAGGRVQVIVAATERGRMLGETRLSWMFEQRQSTNTSSSGSTAFFSPGEKGIFAVQGLHYGSNWALLGWGMRWELFDGWSARAGYDVQVNFQQRFQIGSGSFHYAW